MAMWWLPLLAQKLDQDNSTQGMAQVINAFGKSNSAKSALLKTPNN